MSNLFAFPPWEVLIYLLPFAAWGVSLYLVVRFLRAIERSARAQERIADALANPRRDG